MQWAEDAGRMLMALGRQYLSALNGGDRTGRVDAARRGLAARVAAVRRRAEQIALAAWDEELDGPAPRVRAAHVAAAWADTEA